MAILGLEEHYVLDQRSQGMHRVCPGGSSGGNTYKGSILAKSRCRLGSDLSSNTALVLTMVRQLENLVKRSGFLATTADTSLAKSI